MSKSAAEIGKCGKKDGLEIWRIENMEMIPVPTNEYGNFFVGDSYILLRTYEIKGTDFFNCWLKVARDFVFF